MNFEAYLISKKIDSNAFQQAERSMWEQWKAEFEQMHPNSFTARALYLINPIRRKYPLRVIVPAVPVEPPVTQPATAEITPGNTVAKPKPVMRPKPKMS